MFTDQRGFTLVEAMVAMVICTIGLVSMAQLMAVTLRLQQLGRNSTAAVRLAQDKVDELMSLNFALSDSIQCGGSITDDAPNYNDQALDFDGNSQGYRRRWVVSAGPDPDLRLRTVTVRVIPIVTDNRVTRSFDLTTIIRGAVPGAC
jgi:prepilin-type N-terminal cleavage/methylation domain-containing protein